MWGCCLLFSFLFPLYLYVTILYAEGFIVEKEIYQHFQQSHWLIVRVITIYQVQFSLKMLYLGISWVLCGRSGNYSTPWLVGLSRNDAGWKCPSHFTREKLRLDEMMGNEFGEQTNLRAGAWICITWFQTPLQFTPQLPLCLLENYKSYRPWWWWHRVTPGFSLLEPPS